MGGMRCCVAILRGIVDLYYDISGGGGGGSGGGSSSSSSSSSKLVPRVKCNSRETRVSMTRTSQNVTCDTNPCQSLHFLLQNGTISEVTRPLDRYFVVTEVLL